MKSSLQLKFGQQLSMTPQLQQAIRLLQLSTLDLQQEIQEALDSNPLLEVDDEFAEQAENDNQNNDNTDSAEHTQQDTTSAQENELEVPDSTEHIEQSTISDELSIDASWEDVYSANTGSTGINSDDQLPVYQGETTQTLQDYLEWQLELTPFSDTDRTIARAILDSLDEYGYVTESLDDIQQSLGNDEIELDEIEAVLKRIQQFDPLGVASRNLQECLLLQLAIYPKDTPWLDEAKMVLHNYIDYLGNRDYKLICKEAKLKEDELKQILTLIQQLDPRPGNHVGGDDIEYVVPDVSVFKDRGKWTVTINPDSVPRLKVNQQYAALGKGNSNDSQYIRTHVQEAKWLIKSLESRNETLLKVARCIVEHQQDFFEHGEEAMKPMVLNDIALDVDMHESTISRVTTQKYMHTPKGIFELKYFFSSHVSTEAGGECSSTAIRALIKKLVAAEDIKKPLSDSKIAALLVEQGIQVARRTVAKYRESLGIAPSSQRKRLL